MRALRAAITAMLPAAALAQPPAPMPIAAPNLPPVHVAATAGELPTRRPAPPTFTTTLRPRFASDAPAPILEVVPPAPTTPAMPSTTAAMPMPMAGPPNPSTMTPSTIVPASAPPPASPPAAAPPVSVPAVQAAGPAWGFTADAVFLRPRWPDLELGIGNRRNLGVPNGPVERVEFDPAAGFKLGYWKQWGCDCGFRAEHTYLSVYSHGNIYKQPGGSVAPTLTHPLGLRDVDAGIGTGRHKSNVLDLLWTRRIHSAGGFDLWLEGGPRAAWLQREFGVDYYGGDSAPSATMDHRLAFRGFGLGGGLAGKWRLGYGWALDAGGRLSLLASRNQSSVLETSMRGAALLADVSDTRTGFTPMLDLHIGASKTMGAWTFALGYQMQQWFGVSELLTFNDDVHVGSLNRRRGDFGMDGLYVRLGVAF